MNRQFKTSSWKFPSAATAFWGLLLLLTVGLALPAQAQFQVVNQSLSTMLTSESCSNTAIDPGETVTMQFRIKNVSGGSKANVKATLLQQGNVTFPITSTSSPGAGQTFPYPSGQTAVTGATSGTSTLANNEEATVSFTFRAEGTCGGSITPSISVVADSTAAQTLTYSAITGPSGSGATNELGFRTFTVRDNATPGSGASIGAGSDVTVNDFTSSNLGRATTYPETITVSGVPHVTDPAVTGERASKVEILINGLTHPFSQDLQIVLVGPQGDKIMLMNDAGAVTGDQSLSSVNLVFAQSGGSLPPTSAIASGTYKPSNYGPNDVMPAESGGTAVAAPYGSNLDVFGTTTRSTIPPNPNGTWKLYVVDDTGGAAGSSGSISSWGIRITTMKIDCCGSGVTSPTVAVTSTTAIDEDSTAAGSSGTARTIATLSINDIEANSVTVSAASDNSSVVTSGNLSISGSTFTTTAGSPASKTLQVKANGLVSNANTSANQGGATTITVTVTDGTTSTATKFPLTVNPINDIPTITSIPNQSANVGQPTSQLSFTITDVANETPAANLTLIGTSSDQSVVPNGNIFFTTTSDSGNTGVRTVQVFPATSTTSGTATIRVTVRDRGALDNGASPGEGFTEFVVAFNVQPGFPTITPIGTKTINEDASALTVSFTVAPGSGSSTAAGALVVGASSSNTTLVPSGNISITQPNSSGAASVAITPAGNQNGSTTITLTVTDQRGTAGDTSDDRTTSTTFTLNVTSVNDAPTITAIANQTVNEDTSTGALAFTLTDTETAVGSLQVSVTTSDATVVPATIVTDASLPGVTFGGSGGSRTVSVKPAADAFGNAAITVTVTDADGGTATSTFRVTVNAINDAPVVSQAGISGGTLVNLASNATDAPVAVTVSEDAGNTTVALAGVAVGPANETDQTVNLTVTSGDTSKVKVLQSDNTQGTSRTFTGVGSGPTFVLVTQSDKTGDAVITLDLTDVVPAGTSPGALTTTRKFTFRITAANDAPTLAAISDINNAPTGAGISIPIAASDVETSTANLTVTAVSSNQAVVKDSNIFSVSSNTQLSILTETAPGTTTITVTVTDPAGATAQRSFSLTTSNIAPPSISISPSSATIDEDTVTSATITASGQGTLTFTKASNSTILLPNDNVLISGSGNTRTLVVVPAADQPNGTTVAIASDGTATAIVTVTVTDERGASQSATFTLKVRAIPDNPTISLLGTLAGGSFTMLEDGTATADTSRNSAAAAAGLLAIKAFDAEDGTSVTLAVSSSNTGLIPNGPVSGTAGVTIQGAASDGTRAIEIRPVANKNGSATLTITATDTSGRVAATTLNVTVTAVNDEPLLTQPTTPVNISEDFATQTISLTGIAAGPSDAGESGQTLTLSVSTKNSGASSGPSTFLNASVSSIASDGTATLTLTPIANQSGTAIVTVTVADDGGTANSGDNSKSRDITVNVAAVNDVPTITFANQTITIIQPGGSAGFTVVPFTIGDVETSSFSLTVSGSSDATGVVISPTASDFGGSGTDRSVKLTAASSSVTGTANVTITVSDGTDSASKVLAVTVRVPSQNPEITVSPSQVVIPPNTESQVITLSLSDFQQAASQLSITYTSDNTAVIPNGPANGGPGTNGGTSQVQFQGTGATRQVIVRPVANQFGVATITFTVHDNDTTDHTGTATLRVVVSTAPTATPDSASVNVAQNSGATTMGVTVSDNETASGFLSLAATSNNQPLIPNANISVTAGSANNRRNVTFTPVANQTGTATITLVVTDSDGLTGTNSFVVNVANQAPTITGPTTATIAANTSATLIFTVADAETAAANLGTLNVTPSSNNTTLFPSGSIVITASGATRTVVLAPAANQAGTAIVTLTVADSQGATGTATIVVTVTNAAPTVSPPASLTIAEGGNTGPLSFTVGDENVSTVTVAGSSSNPTLVPASAISIPTATTAARTVTVTPVTGQSGTATITLTATDALGATGTGSFVLTVLANNPPTITGLQNLTTQMNQPVTLTFTVSDTETPGQSLGTTYSSSNSTLINDTTGIQQATATSGSRTIVITPSQGQSGTATITVTVTDSGGKTATGSFTVTVVSNTNPTITTISNQTINKNTSTAALAFTVGDAETAAGSLSLSTTSSNPTIVPNTTANITLGGSGASRTVTVTPAANQTGTVTITITVTDGGGLTANSAFTVTVRQTAPTDGDLNGDGLSDLLFQDSQGFLATWIMRGNTLDPVQGASFLTPSNVGDTSYKIVGSGDFNGDGMEDLLFQHTDGTLAVWYMTGTSQLSADLLTPTTTGDANWRAVGTGDVDRDGKIDIVFQHTNGALAAWMMDGVRLKANGAVALTPNTSGSTWRVAAVADLNGDGNQDLVFQNSSTGDVAAWLMNGTSLITGQSNFLSISNPGGTWKIVGAGQYSAAFSVSMSGAAERPNAVSTAATGSGTVLVQGDMVTVNVSFSGLSGAASAAHIHGPATVDQAAGVIIPLTVTAAASGTVTGSVTATAAQIDMILNGQTYVNIHTAANPGGEIRGQVVRDLTAVRKSDLIFQDASANLGIWYMDGFTLKSAKALSPSNSGGSWKVAAPK